MFYLYFWGYAVCILVYPVISGIARWRIQRLVDDIGERERRLIFWRRMSRAFVLSIIPFTIGALVLLYSGHGPNQR